MGKKNTVKIMVNFRFIGLLLFICLLQHFSFAILQNRLEFNDLHSGIVQNSYFEKESGHHQHSALELYTEVVVEDEDEEHNEHGIYKFFNASKQNFNTEYYSNVIHILFLSLASTNQHKVDLPFFILFHSWKSDLA